MAPINRVTMFKLPSAEARAKVLEQYQYITKNNSKDGKPYILNIKAGSAFPDARSQGYTLAAQTTFKSREDMAYYDTECEAHRKLKAVAGPLHEGVMVVYFEASVTDSS